MPLRGFVAFPGMMVNFDIGRKKSILAVEEAMNSNQLIFLATQKDIKSNIVEKNQIYKVGILAKIKHVLKQEDSCIRILVDCICSAEVKEFFEDKGFISADIFELEEFENKRENHIFVKAFIRKTQELFAEYLSLMSKVPEDVILNMDKFSEMGKISDYISSNIVLDFEKKQCLLEELDTLKRMEKLSLFLSQELEILKCENIIGLKLKQAIDDSQKDYFLREQMRVIAKELGEENDPLTESEEYIKKLKQLKLPKDTFEKISKECKNFSKIHASSSEANVVRTYLDTFFSLPWNKISKDILDLEKAKEILNREHYGLKKVKDRILEFLAVRKLSADVKGQIICLVGPPGVGKTSIAKSLAKSMGRKYVRISLGGVSDESEIRGHRKTYLGAMPGRIINAIKQVKVKNPVILLDEIDKLTQNYHGDPSSALLEALDPEQNREFYDRYLEVPFDLSKAIFIATANNEDDIPEPLYDRMEVINLTSYTNEEKFYIAKNHIIPKQLSQNGLTEKMFSINNTTLEKLIKFYTKEAGVRNLERTIASLMRKTAKFLIENNKKSLKINDKKLEEFLGPKKYKNEKIDSKETIGVARGMAWTSLGGESLPIEVLTMKGKGDIQITGSLGDVMKESAQLAISYIRSNATKLGVKSDFYKNLDIHIHAPEGAVPKDGPSAGVTMATALVSALSKTPVDQNLAMTGEITLKGDVLPIGGLKEKTMAAYISGIKSILVPYGNKSDIEKVDKIVRDSVNFITVKNLKEVFKNALISKEKRKTD